MLKRGLKRTIKYALVSCCRGACRKALLTLFICVLLIPQLFPVPTKAIGSNEVEISVRINRTVVTLPDLYEHLLLTLKAGYNADGSGAVLVLQKKMNLLGTAPIPLMICDIGDVVYVFFDITLDGPETTNEYQKSKVANSYDFFSGSEKKLTDNNYVISSTFRYNNKNFVVFDKYQTKLEIISQHKYIMNYLFTNSLIWCFDDEGEIEWTKNIDYSIISDNLEPKTKAFPYKNNTIAFIGEFDKEVSLITLSMDGDVLDGSEKYPTLKVLDMDEDLVYKNSITPLFGNKYLVWRKENVTSEEAKMKKKKKIYTIGLNLKVIEIQ